MSTSRSTFMGLKCFPGVKANPEVLTLHFLCPIYMQLEHSRASSLLKTCVAKYLARKNLACVGLRRAKIPGTLTVSEMFLLDVPRAWASDPQSRATCMGTPTSHLRDFPGLSSLRLRRAVLLTGDVRPSPGSGPLSFLPQANPTTWTNGGLPRWELPGSGRARSLGPWQPQKPRRQSRS